MNEKPETVETTATEVTPEKTVEDTFLDTMKEKGASVVMVVSDQEGVRMYKTTDIPNVLGLINTAKVMTEMDLQRSMMRPPMGGQPMPAQPNV